MTWSDVALGGAFALGAIVGGAGVILLTRIVHAEHVRQQHDDEET